MIFDCFVSAEVIEELSHPNYPRSRQALALINDVPLVPVTEEALGFAKLLVREKVMPGPLAGDAIHVAAAAVHGIEYILTWNVRHLANPSKVDHLRAVCLRAGLIPPVIVTVDSLWEADHETA